MVGLVARQGALTRLAETEVGLAGRPKPRQAGRQAMQARKFSW